MHMTPVGVSLTQVSLYNSMQDAHDTSGCLTNTSFIVQQYAGCKWDLTLINPSSFKSDQHQFAANNKNT